jgi:hypothetical protein
MTPKENNSQAKHSGVDQGGETNDAAKNTQKHRQYLVLSPRVRGSLPNPTELSQQLEKEIFDSMSDDSYIKTVIPTEQHLASCGLMAIWRKKDRERISRILYRRGLDRVVRDVR